MIDTVEGELAKWPVGEPIDVYPLVYPLALNIIVRSLFDIDLSPASMQTLSRLFNQMQDFVVKDINGPLRKFTYWFTRQDKVNLRRSVQMRNMIREIIVRRRASGGVYNDLLDMLLSARYEDTGEGMTEDQIIDEVLVLLLAGHETTANTLSWLLSLVVEQPAVIERLREVSRTTDIVDSTRNEYLNAVINETMRLRPAAFMTDRLAMEDDQYGDWTYPKGTVVLSFFYGLHRHGDHWQDAESFLPDRWIDEEGRLKKMSAFFPFGAGPRLCIGNNFAMAEMCFFVHAFFRRFKISSIGHTPEMLPLITLRPDKVVINVSPV